MSSVEFEEETNNTHSYTSRKILGEPKIPAMTKMFMSMGIIKDESQSMFVFWTVIIGSILLSIFLIGHFVFRISFVPAAQPTEAQRQEFMLHMFPSHNQ
jgi:hypothetical protein